MNDDAILVEQALAGDKQAFDQLTRRHLPRCYRIARRYGLSPEDAADLAQDTFFAAYRALGSFNFAYQFSTWITRIHLNRLSNFHRGLRRARRFFLRPREDSWHADFLEGQNSSTPEQELVTSELRRSILKALDRLPDRQRLVFILFEMEGFKIREIATMLEIPEGTVTSRLHYARKALQTQLKDQL